MNLEPGHRMARIVKHDICEACRAPMILHSHMEFLWIRKQILGIRKDSYEFLWIHGFLWIPSDSQGIPVHRNSFGFLRIP